MLSTTLRVCTIIIFLGIPSFAYADNFADQIDIEIKTQLQQPITLNIDFPIPDFNIEPDLSKIWHYTSLEKEEDCLAKNIYWESSQEPEEGQIAVGLVTINRLKTGQYADSICGVVYQKGRNRHHKLVAQFSWVLKRVRNKVPRNLLAWEHAQKLAHTLLEGGRLDNVEDFTNGCTYYHATYIRRRSTLKRFRGYEMVTRIGRHIFFRDSAQALLASRY